MEDGALTIPNFLRHYGNNIVGGSLGHHIGEVKIIIGLVSGGYSDALDRRSINSLAVMVSLKLEFARSVNSSHWQFLLSDILYLNT